MLEARADAPKLGLYLQVVHSQQSQPRFKPTQPHQGIQAEEEETWGADQGEREALIVVRENRRDPSGEGKSKDPVRVGLLEDHWACVGTWQWRQSNPDPVIPAMGP